MILRWIFPDWLSIPISALGNEHIVYVPFYMPGEHPKYQDNDQVFSDKVRNYLKAINPSIKDGDFTIIHVSRYRYAQPVADRATWNL